VAHAPPLPPALRRALETRRLVVLAGAGISMLAPASLPDWMGFCEALLDGARSRGRDALAETDPAREAVARIRLEQIGAKGLSEYLDKIIGGELYFPVLDALDGVAPNANHHALAQLAREGRLRAVVTTNFDTLIERAFAELGVPLHVAASAREMSVATTDEHCVLYKVHGSVASRASFIDTVGQKVRGLPPTIRTVLAALFADHHVLVVGYGGADLEFRADYLALQAARESPHGLTWLLRPGVLASPRVQAAVLPEAGMREFMEDALPGALVRCLATTTPLPPTESSTPAVGTDPTGAQLPRIAAFYDRVGGVGALAVLLRMTLDLGRQEDADAIRVSLARELDERPPNDPIIEGLALRQVGFAAHARGDADQALPWMHREIAVRDRQLREWKDTCIQVEERRRAGLVPDVQAPGPFEGSLPAVWPCIALTVEEDLHRLRAGCWSNVANIFVDRPDPAGTGPALERSLDDCELSLSGLSLVHMYAVYSQWMLRHQGTVDDGLDRLATCEASAILFGNLDTANDCAVNQAVVSLVLGEYDAAHERLQQLRTRFSIEASQRVRRAVEVLEGDLAAARSGRAPDLRQLQSLVPDARERAVRGALMRAEASRDTNQLSEALEVLAAMLCNSNRFERGLAVARGYEHWARSLLRSEDVATACCLQAWAHWGIGDYASAGAACASAIIARGAFDARLRASIIAEIRVLEAPSSPSAAVESCRSGMRALEPLGDAWSRRVASLLQLVSEWYQSADPPPATVLPLHRTLHGHDAGLDTADLTERYAAASLARRETTIVRVYAILAAQQHRGVADYSGIARCVDLLAGAADIEQRLPQAERLRERARRYRQL
jgi:hypothetical protein